MMDDHSYGMGWDDGFQKGQDVGYMRGWRDCESSVNERLAKLTVEMRTMEARINVFARRADDADQGHK